MRRILTLFLLLGMAMLSSGHAEGELSLDELVGLCRYEHQGPRTHGVHGRGTGYEELDPVSAPPVRLEVQNQIDATVRAMDPEQRLELALKILEPRKDTYAALNVLEDIVEGEMTDEQKGRLSQAIVSYQKFHQRDTPGILPSFGHDVHLRCLTEVIHKEVGSLNPDQVEPEPDPEALDASLLWAPLPEDDQNLGVGYLPESWMVFDHHIYNEDGGFRIGLDSGAKEELDVKTQWGFRVSEDAILTNLGYILREPGSQWQSISLNHYGSWQLQGDQAYWLWSAPSHYFKLLEGADPLTDREEIQRKLGLKFKRLDLRTGEQTDLDDPALYPFLGQSIDHSSSLLQLESGRLVVVQSERWNRHATQRIYVATSPENSAFEERFSLGKDLQLKTGEGEQLWIVRSTPERVGLPLPHSMTIYDAATLSFQLAYRRTREIWEPIEPFSIGPPMDPKWQLPRELADPSPDAFVSGDWTPWKGGFLALVRTYRVGVETRPVYDLYAFRKDGRVSSPVRIELSLDDALRELFAKRRERDMYMSREDELEFMLYPSDTGLVFACWAGLWMTPWEQLEGLFSGDAE